MKIRKAINEGLGKFSLIELFVLTVLVAVAITGQPGVQMQYEKYDTLIVHKYGVVLEGWTHEKWERPSNLGTAISPLIQLYSAFKDGTCKFRRLTAEEHAQHIAEYENKIASGQTIVKPRKKRTDAGKPRGPRSQKGKGKATIASRVSDEEEDASDASMGGGVGGADGGEEEDGDDDDQ